MNRENIIQYLLDHGVNLTAPDIYGNTACDIAKILKHDSILEIMLKFLETTK